MKNLIIIILSLILISCGHSYFPASVREIDNTKTFQMSYEQTWMKIIDWFALHNTPIKTIDKASGLIASDYELGSTSKYCDCGRVNSDFFLRLSIEEYSGNINILVRKLSDDTTRVTISTFFSAVKKIYDNMDHRYLRDEKIKCYSSGLLEQDIFHSISK
ncbi:MAG: hypothetical protein C0417_08570 [Chlorobiaceae bacterium]|nr:hypothetical protein [Chlorobiaceae bacterium]